VGITTETSGNIDILFFNVVSRMRNFGLLRQDASLFPEL
jgi:hypothetical protein